MSQQTGSAARINDQFPPPAIEAMPSESQKAKRARTFRRIRIVSIIFVILAWEVLGRQVDPIFMSWPTAIAQAAWRMILSGELLAAFLSSAQTLVAAFAIACVIGIGSGLIIGRYWRVEAATDWLVSVLYATPTLALVPLVIIWFGLGFTAKVFIMAKLAIFVVLINTIAGVKNVPPALIDAGRAFCADERKLFMKIIVPSALPYIMAGVRLAVGRSIIAMVVAEFFTAISGLGALIIKYGAIYDTASMFVPVFVLMLLGATLTAAAQKAEEYFAPWKTTQNSD